MRFYVNDFNRNGRVYRVQLQSEGQYRAHPEDLRDVYVKSSNGSQMMPLTAIAKVGETTGPDVHRALQSVPVGATVRRAGAGIQLGAGARRDGRAGGEDAA